MAVCKPGDRYGRLTLISRADSKEISWLVECDCGARRTVRQCHIRSGATVSCGCYSAEVTAVRNSKHGGCGTRLYNIWCAMKQRCDDPDFWAYGMYGGRGIAVCDEWRDFSVFRQWADSHGYSDTLEIDRINNDLGYSPLNCRFVTHRENSRNTRQCKMTPDKVRQIRREYQDVGSFEAVARARGVSASTVSKIVKRKSWADID